MLRSRPQPHLLVMVDDLRIEYHGEEQWAYELLLDHLRARGHEFTVITWDRDQSVLDLDGLGTVRYVEDVNRWRLPTWLAKHHLRPVARRLRHARVRWWWARAHGPRSVLVLGALRPELAHYAPPGAHVGVVLGWRAPSPPTSLSVTLGMADAVLTADAATADRCRNVDPGADVALIDDVWPRLHLALDFQPPPPPAPALAGIEAESALVLGMGPANWSGGVDQFIAMAGRLRRIVPERRIQFAWLGWVPEGPDLYPYRFDIERLGLTGHHRWLGEREDWHEFVQRADVFVVTARVPRLPPHGHIPSMLDVETVAGLYERAGRFQEAPFTLPIEPIEAVLDAIDVPVVRFDLEAASELVQGRGTAVPYPDTAALTAAVAAELDGAPATLRHTMDLLLGPAPS